MDLVVHGFSDLHNQLLDFAHGSEHPASLFGALAAEVANSRLRHSRVPHLFLGAGDDHAGGSPLDVFWRDPALPDPAYAWFDEAGVDAITLGNHDFDLGVEMLVAKLRPLTRTRVVLSNLLPGSPLDAVTAPELVFTFPLLRVAVLGLASRRQTLGVAEGLVPLRDPIATAEERAATLEPTVDALVILSHLGRYETRIDALPTDDDLTAALSGFGKPLLVVGAHTHRPSPPIGATHHARLAYVQNAAYGATVGRAELSGGKFTVEVLPVAPVQAWSPREQHLLTQLADARRRWPTTVFSHPDLLTERVGVDYYRGESTHLNLLCDVGAAATPPDPQAEIAELFALCARTLLRGPFDGRCGLDQWYQWLGFADLLAFVELPWDHLPALLAANARRLVLPIGFLENRGMLHFDKRLRYRALIHPDNTVTIDQVTYDGQPFSSGRYRTIRVHGTAYFAAQLGGYDTVLAEAGIETQGLPRTYAKESFCDWIFGKLLQNGPLDPDRPLRDGRLLVTRQS